MAYVRGHREDYNNWESLGCTGWGWSNVENYFKKMEDYFLPGGITIHAIRYIVICPYTLI